MGTFSLKGDYRSPNIENKLISNDTGVVQGVVKRVYLDFSTDSSGRTIIPGAIEVDAVGRNKSTTIIAYPHNELFMDIPLESELVDIFYNGTIPTYRRINLNKSINNGGYEQGAQNSPTPQTGVSNFKSLGGFLGAIASIGGGFGNYFKKEPIHRLKIFEGDTLIQSKFGQSIRLSGYNNKGNDFEPTLTIRNREAGSLKSTALTTAVEEDLNRDGSTIMMSSGEKNKINFIPGTPGKLGDSDFITRPDKSTKLLFTGKKDDYAFEAFPSSYSGDQCFITSDRLVFSSRKNEMIFWSKGNYGVITDGIFSIDTDKGVNINSKNDIDIQAFDKKINFYIGEGGEINLGDKNLKPTVDGLLLVQILSEIIAEIINLRDGGLLTPAGPTSGMNPIRENKLRDIASKLSSMLSQRVKVQI